MREFERESPTNWKIKKDNRKETMKQCCKDYLAEQFGGDEDVMNEIYEEYVRSVAEKIGELKVAAEKTDWILVDRLAHAMKGNALAAGDAEMAETAIGIRKSAALKEAASCQSGIDRLVSLQGEL